MKMVKKILLGTLAVAAILTLASCGQREEAGNSSIIDVNAGSSKASIDATNDGDSTTRGFKTLQTLHLDAICHIETEVTDLVDKTVDGVKVKSSGTMGYIFNLVKGDDDKYSFTIAGARYNQVAGNIEAYVESFSGIEGDKLEEELTGGVPATGTKSGYGKKAFGFELVDKDTVKAGLDLQTTTPKKLDLWIDVVANGKAKASDAAAPTGRDGEAGTYTVNFYLEDPERDSSTSNYNLTWKKSATVSPVYTCVVEKENVNNKYVESKGLTSMQSDIGFYANVYAGQTLKGKWQFSQIKKEAEEIEE